jgi:hypothetical protein
VIGLRVARIVEPNGFRTIPTVAAWIEALNLRPMAGRMEPTERLVRSFEDRFGLALPRDYRAFLLEHAGSWASAKAPFLVPTPIGTEAMVEELFGFMTHEHGRGDVRNAADAAGGAPHVIPIASDVFGNWMLLVCRGPHTGSVLLEDVSQRASWTDARFRRQFPNLAPSIEEYLRLRRAEALPPSIVNASNCYLVARSFDELVANCSALD